jgi:hypothetical protein
MPSRNVKESKKFVIWDKAFTRSAGVGRYGREQHPHGARWPAVVTLACVIVTACINEP